MVQESTDFFPSLFECPSFLLVSFSGGPVLMQLGLGAELLQALLGKLEIY